MEDRLSDLPDSVICYILSFVSTRDSVATSVLSKRWKLLWRSVPAFDFGNEENYYDDMKKRISYNILRSINKFLRRRDSTRSLTRFSLRYDRDVFPYKSCCPKNVYKLVSNAMQHKLEHFKIELSSILFPTIALSCKTLVVLKLSSTVIESFSLVDLPSLKKMKLVCVTFWESTHLADLISGCPNLEDMRMNVYVLPVRSIKPEPKFKKLSKLTRAVVDKGSPIPLEVIFNVQELNMRWMDPREEIIEELIPQFDNLTQLGLYFGDHNKYWPQVLRFMKHCPKLQHFDIEQGSIHHSLYATNYDYRWQCPPSIPECILSHLKTCRLSYYYGHESDFQFLEYIMMNATVLQKMVIRTYRKSITEGERSNMRSKLLMCGRFGLSTCKLSVE